MARKPKRLPVFVSEDELLEVMKYSKHKHHKFAYMLAWYGGLRISEVLNAEPRDVDMEKGTLLIRQGKNSKDRVTILPRDWKPHMLKYLPIGIANRTLQEALYGAIRRSGVKKELHFHSLRHGFATHLIEEKGVPERKVQKLMGHEDVQTTSIYINLAPQEALDDYYNKFGK